MKLTVLDMVQDIMYDMHDDNVNSVNDTANSIRVAQIIKSTYDKLIGREDWPFLGRLIQLSGLGDTDHPIRIKIADSTRRIEWIKYDKQVSVDDPVRANNVDYMKPKEFIDLVQSRDSTASNIQVVIEVVSSVPLNIRNDTAPTFWTSFDDEFILFDSFDSGVESTIQTSKLSSFGIVEPAWNTGDLDVFIPVLPAHMFPILLGEAKVQCFNKIKQTIDQLEMRDAKRAEVSLQQSAFRQDGQRDGVDYGRK